jgi:hypothetical protein
MAVTYASMRLLAAANNGHLARLKMGLWHGLLQQSREVSHIQIILEGLNCSNGKIM